MCRYIYKCSACLLPLFLNCWNEESGIKFHTKCNILRTGSTGRSSRSSNISNRINRSDSRNRIAPHFSNGQQPSPHRTTGRSITTVGGQGGGGVS